MLLFFLVSLAAAEPVKTSQPVAKPVDVAKEADIRKLMDATGMSQMPTRIAGMVMQSFKEAYAKVPDTMWTDLAKQLDTASCVSAMVPIFDRQFSAEEMKQLVAFYESPVGKKLTKALPQISAEGEEVAEKWAHAAADRMTEQLEAKGYKLPRSAAPAPAPTPR